METSLANHQNTRKVLYIPQSTSQQLLTWIWNKHLEMKQLYIKIHFGLMPIISLELVLQNYVYSTQWRYLWYENWFQRHINIKHRQVELHTQLFSGESEISYGLFAQ